MKSISPALAIAALALTSATTIATDPLAPRPNGMAIDRPTSHILMGATIHLSPTETYPAEDNPAILIENGTIVGVFKTANTIRLKPGYQTHQLDPDQHIYAGFIDAFVEVDAQALDQTSAGTHHNRFVTPQRDALIGPGLPNDKANSLRQLGFTTAMIAPNSGVFRGWTATISTADSFNDPSLGLPPIYKSHTAQMMGFDRTSWRDADYPTSHMGVMSLMRQSFIDAEHFAKSKSETPSCLSNITPKDTTLFYDTDHELESLLAGKVADEFNHKNLVIVGSGTEHRRLSAITEMGFPVIVPMTFPKEPEVWTINDADAVTLTALQHWERAPANARWLSNSGLTVALTSSKLRKDEKFYKNLHTAIERGLPKSDALAMLTTNPAEILNLDNQGTIENGNVANLVITSADLFDPDADAKIIDTWIDGRKHHINDPDPTNFDGYWGIHIVGTFFTMNMEIEGKEIIAYEGEGDDLATNKARKVEIKDNAISFIIDDDADGSGSYIMSGTLLKDGAMKGTGLGANQKPFNWTANIVEAPLTIKDYIGTWDAVLAGKFELSFKITKDDITIIEHTDGDDINQTTESFNTNNNHLEFAFDHTPFGAPGIHTIIINNPNRSKPIGGMGGTGTLPNKDTYTVEVTKADDKNTTEPDHLPDLPDSPFGPYAFNEIPTQDSVLIHNATIWTQSDKGILNNAWIILRNGKIKSIGTGPHPEIAVDHTIDAKGKHVSPGLIDAHSHTGLFRFGVNESGQAITAECRIEDSLDPGYIGWYRELAGGLTTAQLLHGSANPMGGQSKTVKIRWNSAKPQDMFFEDAKPGIKFALGENVKQSNWGDDKTTRYPQTRMGVETIMRDRFTKAREYAGRGMKTVEGSQDLELITLTQILAGDRLVHSHSYRQDEILMLCRIAEDFDFKIGTFQHGLETYKVAEIVKQHAIGASIFSDWWAYKVEVTDAIPYAGPINHEVGLLTSFNSDSDDLARRMNVEAAKALKYSRASGIAMTEQEALAFVTNNPAIQLGIIDRVGTLEVGKDADLVIWSGPPLSSMSRAEATFIDGRKYFSLEDDAAHRSAIDDERTRLIQKIVTKDAKGNGEKKKASKEDKQLTDDHDPDLTAHDCEQRFPHWHTNY